MLGGRDILSILCHSHQHWPIISSYMRESAVFFKYVLWCSMKTVCRTPPVGFMCQWRQCVLVLTSPVGGRRVIQLAGRNWQDQKWRGKKKICYFWQLLRSCEHTHKDKQYMSCAHESIKKNHCGVQLLKKKKRKGKIGVQALATKMVLFRGVLSSVSKSYKKKCEKKNKKIASWRSILFFIKWSSGAWTPN